MDKDAPQWDMADTTADLSWLTDINALDFPFDDWLMSPEDIGIVDPIYNSVQEADTNNLRDIPLLETQPTPPILDGFSGTPPLPQAAQQDASGVQQRSLPR